MKRRNLWLAALAGVAVLFGYAGLSSSPPAPGAAGVAAAASSNSVPAPLPLAGDPSQALITAASRTPAPVVYADRLGHNAESFKGASLPDRLMAMSLRRDGRVFDPQQVADALKSDAAWQSDDSAADKLPITAEERRDGREFIRMDPLKIEALMPGDELSLPLKQVQLHASLRMVVDSVESGKDGVTWHGHLKDYPNENQVSLTRGKDLIVGGISTPERTFVVEVHGNVGWVVDGFTLFKEHRDPLPPHGERATPVR